MCGEGKGGSRATPRAALSKLARNEAKSVCSVPAIRASMLKVSMREAKGVASAYASDSTPQKQKVIKKTLRMVMGCRPTTNRVKGSGVRNLNG